MTTYTVAAYQPGDTLVIGATGLADVLQCLALILSTAAGTVALDRRFATPSRDMVDKPAPGEAQQYLADMAEAVETYETRVKVESCFLEESELAEGVVRPAIEFSLVEGWND